MIGRIISFTFTFTILLVAFAIDPMLFVILAAIFWFMS